MKEADKQRYVDLVEFLGIVMGSSTEVVLHIMDSFGYYIGAIANGHVSGRTVDSPITGLALDMIRSKAYRNHSFLCNYKGIGKNGNTLKSSTYFIKNDEDELEGLLCINADVSSYLEAAETLMGLASFGSTETKQRLATHVNPSLHTDEEMVEYFSDSIQDIVYTIIPRELIENPDSLKYPKRLEIINELYKQGVFAIKGAVSKVASILNISEPSVYRYLQTVKNEIEI